MKKTLYFGLITIALLFTSCAVTIQKHGLIHDNDLEITLEDECGETELLAINHEHTLFGSNFFLSMPFIRVSVVNDGWNSERYVDIDLFH